MTAPLPAPLPPPLPFDEHDDHLTVEVLNGITLMSPRPALPHMLVQSQLSTLLMHRFGGKSGGPPDRPGGFILMFEPELRLGPDILVPDLAGWRRERMPEMPEGSTTDIIPDWICEILSPSNANDDTIVKMRLYHQAQVKHYWLLDPQNSVGQDFLRFFWNSFYVSVLTTLLAVAVAVPAADTPAQPSAGDSLTRSLTPIAAGDANWGRVVMAVGKTAEPVERDRLCLWFGDHQVAKDGARSPDYSEERATRTVSGQEVFIRVDVGVGRGKRKPRLDSPPERQATKAVATSSEEKRCPLARWKTR